MGVSRTTAELKGKITRAQSVFGEAGDRKSLVSTSEVVKATMLRSAVSAGLRPGSKIAGKPWRGVYVRNQGTRDLAVGYASPAHLVNSPTKAHVVGARGLGTRAKIRKRTTGASVISLLMGGAPVASQFGSSNRKGAKALHFGNQFAAVVHVRGTRGKRFYERAVPLAQQEGGKEYGRSVDRTLARIFE